MALLQLPVGSKVRLNATFVNDSGAPDDPSSIVFRVVPAGTDAAFHRTYGTDVEVVRDGIGVYHLDITLDAPGDWWYSAEGTGNVEAYHEALITCLTRRIAEAV